MLLCVSTLIIVASIDSSNANSHSADCQDVELPTINDPTKISFTNCTAPPGLYHYNEFCSPRGITTKMVIVFSTCLIKWFYSEENK